MLRRKSAIAGACLSLFLGLLTVVAAKEPADSIRRIDFANFTYPFIQKHFVPGKLIWLAPPRPTITLKNGRFSFIEPGEDPEWAPLVTFDKVVYGELTGDSNDEAVVVLSYHTGGTAYWEYVYIFGGTGDKPTVIGHFRCGSRSQFGLRRIEVQKGLLMVETQDPRNGWMGDCCARGFSRTWYRFDGKQFRQHGRSQFTPLPDHDEEP